MGLDIYCRADILNALLAAEESSSATAAILKTISTNPEKLRAFRQGYKAALVTVARAFGIDIGELSKDDQKIITVISHNQGCGGKRALEDYEARVPLD